MSSQRRVALALGSGGARGYAHLGVVQVLQEQGYAVSAVAGTSMGAVVGGVLAAGRLDEFTEWALSLKQRDVLRMLDLKLGRPGAIAADRLLDSLEPILGDLMIEDLPIPFTAVATDLGARREVWFQRGPLRSAIRASIAIPGLFTPVMINGRLLVDGGLMNPVPVDPIAASPAELTVAVSLSGARRHRESAAPTRESAAPQRFEEWRGRLRRTVASVTGRDHDGADDDAARDPIDLTGPEPLPEDLRLVDVTAQSFEAMQGLIARYRMAALPADLVIDVPVDAARTMDFHRAADLIEIGRTLTLKALRDSLPED